MGGMYGKYTHSVDAKGRLFVPSKLREKLGERFYVMIGLENSLLVYPEERWESIRAAFDAVKLSDVGKLRFLLANVAECEPDKQGRFLIPQLLRSYAHLENEVIFLGASDHAEIWNAADYAAKEAAFLSGDGQLAAALKELDL